MADYRELYLEMMRATERAIQELIRAQQYCEEKLLQEADHAPRLIVLSNNKKDRT